VSSIHATAVLIGEKAVLIRGASGSGKSRLALRLLQDKRSFTRLIGDDRVFLTAYHERLIVSPAMPSLLEVRSQGIIHVPYEKAGVVALVFDLEHENAIRMPENPFITLENVTLPHYLCAKNTDPLPLLYSLLDVSEN
jgi:HPr kinase/phosphorylase